jgi:ADP-heptose:LPS heptosyltransferase
MRVVDCIKDFNRNGFDFKSGHGYVMPDDVEQQFRSVSGDCLGMSRPIETVYKPYKGENLDGKRLFFYRFGGIGDLLFISSIPKYLKRLYPTCFIRAASGSKQPLENNPFIDELLDMPFDVNLLNDVDFTLQFQGIIELSNDKSKKTPAVDMFFSYFGIDSTHIPAEEKKPQIVINAEELKWVEQECKNIGISEKDLVIGIQMESSAPLRNYPKESLKIIVDILAREDNVKVVLIGSQQQALMGNYLKGDNPNIINAINYDVRKSIVMANRYNIVIAPDSFMIQVAGAMDKPLIGLYGPFPSELRMKYFRNAIALEPKTACTPCFKHDFQWCIKGAPSPCFSLITPEEVLEAADYLRHKHYGNHFKYMEKILKEPDFSEIETYLMSADKGLCFFGGYYKHPNMIHVDTNKYVGADIDDLNNPFERNFYPFVMFMNRFDHEGGSLYNNTKGMVRPGGYFISVRKDCIDQMFDEIKKDLGKTFTLVYSKLSIDRVGVVIGKRPF